MLPTLTPTQQLVFDSIRQFLKSDTHRAFILKGYAGTGKTFLMQQLAQHLSKKGASQPFYLLATTGRAAAVLRGKTGFEAKTVHSALYSFSRVEGDSDEIEDDANFDQFGQMSLRFDIRVKGDEPAVYIIDEASMLTSEIADKTSFAEFGSGRLLIDLLENIPSGKFIFVGDPCQLPPIGQDFSPALSKPWLEEQGINAKEGELSEILRTTGNNDMLIVASLVRKLLEEKPITIPKWPKLPALNRKNISVFEGEDALFAAYWQSIQEGPTSIAISTSNAQCYKINEKIRLLKYKIPHAPLQVGDRLLVTQNNYIVPLTNGDFIEVLSIGQRRHRCNLAFVSVRVQNEITGTTHEILLIEDLLTRRMTNITPENHRELMIAYSKECRSNGIKPNTQLYKEGMMKDPYLNALRATFGYAVTCHKAQGGEWENVFLFLHKGMYAMPPTALLRWWYTAITRAKTQLNLHKDWWLN